MVPFSARIRTNLWIYAKNVSQLSNLYTLRGVKQRKGEKTMNFWPQLNQIMSIPLPFFACFCLLFFFIRAPLKVSLVTCWVGVFHLLPVPVSIITLKNIGSYSKSCVIHKIQQSIGVRGFRNFLGIEKR